MDEWRMDGWEQDGAYEERDRRPAVRHRACHRERTDRERDGRERDNVAHPSIHPSLSLLFALAIHSQETEDTKRNSPSLSLNRRV